MGEIKIYTVSGRLIKKMTHLNFVSGFNHYPWNGYDENEDPIANGVYFYKIVAKTHIGGDVKTTEEIQKLIIMR